MAATKIPQEPIIIGNAYNVLKKKVEAFAKEDLSVLFAGERGSGKEMFAQLYFAKNKRKHNMTINCAAFPPDLLRSEIFGHMKGSFTSAIEERTGKLEACAGGILFLDELGDAGPEFQAAILRVVEQNSFSKLGSDKEVVKVDVRIIAATNKPNELREDLKDRFNILYVPPLQKSDIPTLVRHILKKPLKTKYLNVLIEKDYPGNVRELIRESKELKAKNGEKIFYRRNPIITSSTNFDYNRFVREYETWLKYIQPIIKKFNLIDIKYKYSPPRESITVSFPYRWDTSVKWYESINESICWLQRIHHNFKTEMDLINFTARLRAHLRKNELPTLLFVLSQYGFDATNDEYVKEIEKERLKNTSEVIISKPDFSKIHEIDNIRQAEKEFKKIYLSYHLLKNKKNITKTAQKLNINPGTLRRGLYEAE